MRTLSCGRRWSGTAALVVVLAAAVSIVGARPAAAACMDDAMEENDDVAQATSIPANSAQTGQICTNDVDFFAFAVSDAGQIQVDLLFTHAAGDLDMGLSDGTNFLSTSEGVEDNEHITYGLTPGTYYIEIVGFQGAENSYQLLTAFTPSGGGGSSQTASQTTSIGVRAPAGSLSISLQNPGVSFGTDVAPGSTVQGTIGNVFFTNTLGDGSPWSTSVAASRLTGAEDDIPFTALSFTPGTQIDPSGPTPGAGGTFSGDIELNYSQPVAVADAPGSVQGSFTQSGSQASLTVPSGARGGAYTGTLQYTIVG
jgi:hypothetical protein